MLASFSQRKQLVASWYWELPRKGWLLYLAVRIPCLTSPGREQRGMGISNRMGLKLSCKAMIQTYRAALIWVFQFEFKGRLEPCWSPVWTSRKLKAFQHDVHFLFNKDLAIHLLCYLTKCVYFHSKGNGGGSCYPLWLADTKESTGHLQVLKRSYLLESKL